MANLSPEKEALLRQQVAVHDLHSVEALILKYATECARLYRGEPEDYSALGNSRYGGTPDLPPSLSWPRDNDDKLLVFLMQINLSEVPPFTGNILPDQGLLYCFIESEEPAHDGIVRVLYVNEGRTTLQRVEEPAAEDFVSTYYDGLVPHRILIAPEVDLPQWTSDGETEIMDTLIEEGMCDPNEAESRYTDLSNGLRELQGVKSVGSLLGQPCWIGYIPETEEIADKRLLWRLNSDSEVGISFWDAGYLQIFIGPDELINGNFRKVTAAIETS